MAVYERHEWEVNEPITKRKMNEIEAGLYATSVTATNNEQTIQDISTAIGVGFNASNRISDKIALLRSDVDTIQGYNPQGMRIEIDDSHESIRKNSSDPTQVIKYTTLSDHLDDLDELGNEILAARGTYLSIGDRIVTISNKADETAGLADRIEGSLTSVIEQLDNATVSNTPAYLTLDARLEAMTTATSNVATEVSNAHGVNAATGEAYASLAARLNGIDADIVSAIATANAYTDSEIGTLGKKVDGVTDYASVKDYVDTLLNLGLYVDVPAYVSAAITSNNTNVDVSEIAGAHRQDVTNDTLDNRFDDIEASISHAADVSNNDPGGLTERLEIIEGDINTATTGIKARLDAIDNSSTGAIKALQDVDTGFSTRLDAIDGGTALTGTALGTRVSNLETAIDHAASDNDPGGLTQRITALETEPKSATVIITKDRIVYDDETGDPTIYEDSYDENELENNVEITPSPDVDYLLQGADNKYYYWKYIEVNDDPITYEWNLISGGGASSGEVDPGENPSGGTSSAVIDSALPLASEANENIDYYIGNSTNGYIHYRYIPSEDPEEDGAFITILPKNLINSVGVGSITVTTADATNEAPAETQSMSGGLLAYTLEDTGHNTNLLSDFKALRYVRIRNVFEDDGITLKKQELIFTDTSGTEMSPIEIKGGGGGGALYSIRIIDTTGSTDLMAPASSSAVTTISLKPIVNFGSTVAEGVTIRGNVQYKLSTEPDSEWRNTSITIPTITNNTPFTLNVSSLLGEADTTTDIKVTLSTQPDGDQGEVYTKSLTYHVTTVEMSIESVGFDQSAIRTGNQFTFNYKCYGYDLSKTVTFIIDETTTLTEDVGKSHNEPLSKTISMSGLSDGMHTLRVYYTVAGARSNELNYYFIYNSDSSRVTPIVAVAGVSSSIHYGDDLSINYTVYTPGQENTDAVNIEVYTKTGNIEVPVSSFSQANVKNSEVILFTIPEYPLNQNQYTIYVRITASKTITTIDEQTQEPTTTVLSDTQVAEIVVLPADLEYELKYADPQNNNLVFMYSTAGKSNNALNKETYQYLYTPHDGNDPFYFTAQFNDFNWATNGYIADRTTGENALVVSGGATVNVNVPIFSRTYTYTPEGGTETTVNIEADSSKTSINQNGRTIELDYEVVSTVDANSTIFECIGANGAGFRVTPQCCYLQSTTTRAAFTEDSSGFITNESSVAAAYLSTGQRIHLVFVIEPEAESESAVGGYHQCVNIYVNGEFANSQPYSRGTVFASNATMSFGNSTTLMKLYGIRMYNRGFNDKEVLQNYMMAPSKINDKLARFRENDVLDSISGLVNYSKAMKKYNCLLLTGVMSPYKGSPSTIRFDGVDQDNNPIPVKKRESALVLTKPSLQANSGYVTEFSLYDKLSDGGYASSNNVQGTSSQKYPIHNLKVYLAKGKEGTEVFDTETDISVKEVYKYSITTAATAAYKSVYTEATDADIPSYIKNCASTIATQVKALSDVPTQAEVVTMITDYLTEQDENVGSAYTTYSAGNELMVHPIKWYTKSEKVKYKLNGSNSIGESTLCWKADYMSTDHANTYNANLANGLFSVKLPSQDPEQGGDTKVQNTVKGIRCLLFVRADENSTPVFIGDGCLNNDKGNNKTFGLEYKNEEHPELSDNGTDTLRQKWEFTNNSEGLCLFKSDHIYELITSGEGASQTTDLRAKGGFESTYPDQGDLEEEGLEPNYTHLQILLTWVCQRANFWDASTTVETTTIDGQTVGAYEYNGTRYNTEAAYRKAIFLNEFSRHFVLNHVLTYYIFSEFIALCDNRAKNLFLRCDDVRSEIILQSGTGNKIFTGNRFGDNDDDDTLWNTIVNHTTGAVDVNAIDWENSTFAVWAPVLYDLDSCYGVENVGYLTIPYDADWYYNLRGLTKSEITKTQIDNPDVDPANKISFQFSGIASRLWLMVEEAYASNIRTLAKTLYSRDDGLNYYNIYTSQIEDNQIETSPALVNQDMILKFQNPWETGFIDYSQKPPTQSTEVYKYLQRGTKTCQKDSFVYRRATLLSSQYQADSFIKGSINFRTNISVPGDQLNRTGITVTANQMIYPAVTYGDNKASISSATKIPANTPCTFYATAEVGATDTIHIAGGAVLTDVGDLSKWSPYEVKVGLGANLKRLILGNKTTGYENLKLDRLDLSNCQLLEIINVENCKALEELDVSGNGLIKEVYTHASNIKVVNVPNGGVLTKLHLGSKVTSIKILNQSHLTDFFYEGTDDVNNDNPYASVDTLWIENTPNVPIVDIVTSRLLGSDQVTEQDHGITGLRLTGINLTIDNTLTAEEQGNINDEYIHFLEMLTSNYYAQGKYLSNTGEGGTSTQFPVISGTIEVISIRESLVNKCAELYPDLTINSRNIPIPDYPVIYKNVDAAGNKTTLLTIYCGAGSTIPDPVTDQDPVTGQYYIMDAPAAQITNDGIQWVPARAQDAQYIYRFGTYNNSTGKYNKYSGWEIEDNTSASVAATPVNGQIILLAKYPAASNITRTYTITWYDEDGSTIIGRYRNIAYGTDLSNITAPGRNVTPIHTATADVETLVTKKVGKDGRYKVFSGWDKPLTILTGDINVYSQWIVYNNSISTLTGISDLNDLDAAAWYYLTTISGSARNTLLRDHLGSSTFDIQLGKDFNYDNYITTYNLLNPLPIGEKLLYFSGEEASQAIKFDGTNDRPSIYPLSDLSQDFTLALDFKFLLDSDVWGKNTGEFVLASCFQLVGNAMNGFKISLDKNAEGPSLGNSRVIKITWGTASTAIDYCVIDSTETPFKFNTYRNMIVIRHIGSNPEERNKLYIYHAVPSGEPYYYNNSGITRDVLTWGSAMTVSAPLILGGSQNSSGVIEDSSNRTFAKGNIYYGKYWAADIGNGNCLDLAAWPHETVSYKIMGYKNEVQASDSNYKLVIGNNDNTININFVPAQAIGDRSYRFAGDDFTEEMVEGFYTFGWANSGLRTFCNNRIYNALPIEFQSLIEQAVINSNNQIGSRNMNVTLDNSNYNYSKNTEDYIYIPSYREIEPDTNVLTQQPWRLEAIHAWPWMDTGSINNVYTISNGTFIKENNIQILNYLRFQFFNYPIKPTAKIFHMSNLTNPGNNTWYIQGVEYKAEYGDIWYNDSEAYIFIPLYEVAQGAVVDANKTTQRGAWARAVMWATRSFNTQSGRGGYAADFIKVLRDGSIDMDNVYQETYQRALVPEFSI